VRAALDTAGFRRELARRGMSQRELAVAAGVSEPTVSHAMAGRMVSYLTIRKFARALTVTPPLLGSDGIIATLL
jgi:transcriptional regulator with XRE-family HTH domain